MECNNSNIGFIKTYNINNSFRYIPVIDEINLKDLVSDPYLFTYEYSQRYNTINYSSTSEGLNNQNYINQFSDSGENFLLYIGSSFMPQLSQIESESEYICNTTNYMGEDNINYKSLYFILLPGEYKFELYSTSLDLNDPHGINDPSNTELLYSSEDKEDKVNFLRSIKIGISSEFSSWNYSNPIVIKESNPVKWVTDLLEEDHYLVPTAENTFIKNSETVEDSDRHLKIGDRIIKSVPSYLDDVIVQETYPYTDPF